MTETISRGAANQAGAHIDADAYARAADFLPLKGIDHVEFWVGNARQAAAYYRALWGFTPVAYSGLETKVRDRCDAHRCNDRDRRAKARARRQCFDRLHRLRRAGAQPFRCAAPGIARPEAGGRLQPFGGERRAIRGDGGAAGLAARTTLEPREAVEGLDVVITTVPEGAEVLEFLDTAWVAPGAFVGAVDLGRSWKRGALRARIHILATDEREQNVRADGLGTHDVCGALRGGPRRSGERRFQGAQFGDAAHDVQFLRPRAGRSGRGAGRLRDSVAERPGHAAGALS